MDPETKRHIDAARQVLVGVVPNPASQIDQITYALIYKFMDDMDQAAIKNGDKPAFFTGDLEPYSWARLMDSRVGDQERMNLYIEAFLKFGVAKQLPELFRNILKSAFLPYRSPETLGLFLKEIDFFNYSHPEELGNAYEYLLSIMGSQGDAGQFRTPRHIIDFIVKVINPNKGDKILDPACGTAGFLVKSYQHILEQHDGKNDPEKKEKPLTPDQRRNLMHNFEGYDIDPTMVRIAQVNMYLHQFKNPQIFQYDSLSSDERWNDKFDVILANPPFMSPKGGIRPHNKFSIQSSRSEVLFVDYIINHLRPKGRAGIIVPEGIVSQSGQAYKQLRKNLVNDGLYAVISLPSGIFQPYAGVKTNILFFDNEIAKQRTKLLFIKISNDGFDLGATKRPIGKNDLPQALEIMNKWRVNEKVENKLALYVEKSKIADNGEYNLSGENYRITTDYSSAKWAMVDFDDFITTITPPVKIQKKDFGKIGSFPIIDQSQEEISGWTNDEKALVKNEKPLVIFGDHTCVIKYINKPFAQGADGIKILLTNEKLIPKYFYYLLKTKPIESEGYQRHFAKLKRYKIPLPPLEIQGQVVKELENYQNIITGAKQIVQSWKPKIDTDVGWEKVKLGDIASFKMGGTPTQNEINSTNASIPWVKGSDLIKGHIFNTDNFITIEGMNNSRARYYDEDTVLIGRTGQGKTRGTVAILKIKATTNETMIGIFPNNNKLDSDYLFYHLGMRYTELRKIGGENERGGLTQRDLGGLTMILPSFSIQKQIVEKIEIERIIVESTKKLIEIYNQKTKDTISKLWSK